MSDTETPEEVSDFEPITSSEQLEKIIGGRLERERKKYSDYQDLKTKAAKLDELEAATAEANKSWEQRYTELENQMKAKDLDIMRIEVAAAKGVPANRIHGTTREELEADADELAAMLVKADTKPLKAGVLKSGASGESSRMDPKQRAAEAIRAFRNT